MHDNYNRDTETAALVTKTSRITGVSKRFVRMVISGERTNELVLDTYMLFQEGNEALLEQARQMNRQIRKMTAA